MIEAALNSGFGNQSDTALGTTWARATLDSKLCLRNESDIGDLIGTAYVARDLISVVDALEEDGMLRFWGFSYGTNLGSTVAAMFPERVDKLILDGVQNPHEYWHALADFEEWTDSDKVLHGIFKTCFELPERCALHTNDTNADELEQKFWNLLDHIKYYPIVGASRIVDYNALKLVMASSLYTTVVWGILAHALQGLFDGVVNESMDLLLSVYWPSDLESVMDLMRDTMALQGIHCSDRYPRVDTFEEYLPAVQRLYNSSRIMGDSSLILNMACAQWPFHAKERYEGDFNVETANPILVIGNHFDSHTPLVSAYNISTSFVGSRVLEIAGYGVCHLPLPPKPLAFVPLANRKLTT
jgi:pimeloyl-ACP methyl ester carboxylesterase